MDLTAAQRAIVEHDGRRGLAVGGPGTGKTTALVERYRRLAAHHAPGRVLVVCRDRGAAQRFTARVLPRLRGGLDSLPVTTVYGLAYDVMSRAGEPVHLLSGAQHRVRMTAVVAAETPAEWPVLGHLLGRPAFAAQLVDALAEVDAVGSATAGAAGGAWAEVAAFAARYRVALAAIGQTDAGGLLSLATAVAEPGRFDHVIVDDAGEVGRAGATLLESVIGAGAAITVAADPGAGAVPVALTGEPALVSTLEEQFRVVGPGTLVRCNHPSIEPEAVAGEVLKAHAAGAPWSQIAVLVRSLGPSARAVARALARHGVPVVPVPALAAEEPVVKAVVDLLRWVDGDAAALDRLIVSPLAGLDPARVRTLRREALAEDRPLEADPDLNRLVGLRDHLRALLTAGDTPADLAYEAWARGLSTLTGRQRVGGLGAIDERALDGLVALVNGLAGFAERNPNVGLADTLAAIDAGELTPDPWRTAGSAGTDGVTITTHSAAAGQEWDTVVVTGCVEGELPRVRLRTGLLDPCVLAGGPSSADERRRLALATERRLFEVATSRATNRLVATAAPQPGVLLSRFVEAWPQAPAVLPLAPGQAPPVRAVTAGATPLFPGRSLRLSATRLSTYDDCPLRYAYEYVLGARDEAGVHASLGSMVHEVLAKFLDPKKPVPRTFEGLMEVADGVWRDDVARYRPQVEEVRRDFVAMLTAWWEQEGSNEELGPEVLAVERRFEFDVGPHHLVGFIDRVDRADDATGVRVVDYKTGKREPSPADMVDDLQLAVYHLAATRDPELVALGQPTQLQLRYLRRMRTYHLPVTEGLAQATEARVLATADRILDEELEPAVDANCRTCSYHRLCPLQPQGRQVDQGQP